MVSNFDPLYFTIHLTNYLSFIFLHLWTNYSNFDVSTKTKLALALFKNFYISWIISRILFQIYMFFLLTET